MTSFPSNVKPRFEDAAAPADNPVLLTVTGMDTKGQMFRQACTILMLDGNECVFRSKLQPELDGSILAEFTYRESDAKRRVSQGRVKSNAAELDGGTYRVEVQLEIAQTVKIPLQAGDARSAAVKPQSQPQEINRAEVNRTELKVELPAVPRELPVTPKPVNVVRTFPQPAQSNESTIVFDTRDLLPKSSPESGADSREAIRSAVAAAVASEIKQQMNLLKGWISTEMNRVAPAIISPMLEKSMTEIAAHQVNTARQSPLHSINGDLARQVGDRIAESADLRSALERMAKQLCEEQIQVAQIAGKNAEEELNSRANAIVQSFEKSVAEMEARISNAPARVEQELNQHAAGIVQSFEHSLAEIEAKVSATPSRVEQDLNQRTSAILQSFEQSLAEVESKISGAPFRVEQELSHHAAGILQSFEESLADVQAKIESAPDRVQEELNSRTALFARSLEESAAQLEAKIDHARISLEQDLSYRANEIVGPLEHSLAEAVARINNARTDLESVLGRAQNLKDELRDETLVHHEVLEQLNQAEAAAIENIEKRAAEQLARGSSQFENQLNNICAVRTIAFVMEIEKHLMPHRQRAEEDVEKLGAVLQLVQGTARAQQERLAELSRTAVANVEREIKQLLLRLGGAAD